MKVVLLHLDAGDVYFHLNDVSVDTVDGSTEGLVEHASRRLRRPVDGYYG